MTTNAPAPAFGVALRDWRARRRVSQLELAVRSGTTQRHLSFLETGRSTPGRDLVIRLAEALEVPVRERNTLLLTAGYAPAYAESGLEGPQLRAVRGALEGILRGHLPCPAVVVDRRGGLVLANAAFSVLVAGVAPRLLEPPVNVPRVLLHPLGLAPRIVNLAEWGRHVVERIRAEAERSPHPDAERLAVELTRHLPARSAPPPDYLGFAVPLRLHTAGGNGELRLITTITHFGTAVDVTLSELRLEAFLPADDATADQLAAALVA